MTWTTWLADIALKSSAVLLCAYFANRLLLRQRPAATRHAVWILALASSLAAPALTAFLPRWHVPLLRITSAASVATPGASGMPPLVAAFSPSPAARPEPSPLEAGRNPLADDAANPAPKRVEVSSQSAVSPATASQPGAALQLPSWSTFATAAWLLVGGLLLLRQTVAMLRTARLSRRARIPGRAPWMALARSLARSIGAPATRFLRSEAISMPIACGVMRPTVVLPADADAWPDERVRVVLLHELAHVRRRDCLTQAIADAACAVFWFNPLAWMAVRELRRERERACDDMVLAAGTKGPDYAAHLLDIARAMRGASLDSVFSSGVAMAHRSELEGRLMAILDDARPRRGLTARGLVLASTFSMAIVTPLAAMNPWVFDEEASAVSQLPTPRPAPTPTPTPTPTPRPSQSIGRGEGHGSGSGEGHGDGEAVSHAIETAMVESADVISTAIADGIAAARPGAEGGVPGGVAGGVVGGIVGGITSSIVAPHVAPFVNVSMQPVLSPGSPVKVDEKGRKPADPKMVAALTEALKDTDAEVRKAAMHALTQLRDPSTFDAMLVALKDKDEDVRQQAAFSLGQFRDKRAVGPLTGVLNDASPDVRQQAVFALGQLRDPSTIDALTVALKDSDAEVRQQAAFALSQLRDARALPALITALQDKDEEVRQQAAFALSQIRDPRAVDGLLIAIKDSNAEVRQQALFALGQIGDPRATDAAMAALKDPDPEVRQQAAHALGQMLRGKD
jgi:beta-lactamase regulating signal transducer with metallopeptidase domain